MSFWTSMLLHHRWQREGFFCISSSSSSSTLVCVTFRRKSGRERVRHSCVFGLFWLCRQMTNNKSCFVLKSPVMHSLSSPERSKEKSRSTKILHPHFSIFFLATTKASFEDVSSWSSQHFHSLIIYLIFLQQANELDR